jgi:hypothetical protein
MPKRSRPLVPPANLEPIPDPSHALFTARAEGVRIVVTIPGLGDAVITRREAYHLIGELEDAISLANGINPRSGEPI